MVYQVYKPYEVHDLELYSRANLFSLKYRRNYFLFNMMFRLIQNENIELAIQQRETWRNRAPTVKTYIALNDTIGVLCVINRDRNTLGTKGQWMYHLWSRVYKLA